MRTARVAAVLLAALGCSLARAGAPRPRRAPPITEIKIEGLRTVRRASVLRWMALAKGEPFREQDLLRSRERLLETGHFDDVRFTVVPAAGGVSITVEFVEAPVVKEILFAGPGGGPARTHLRERHLREHLSFREGERLRRGVAEAGECLIAESLRGEGYLDVVARARIEPVAEGQVRVVYEIDDGLYVYVAQIRFEGNRAVSDRALLGARLAPGVPAVESRARSFLRSGRYAEDVARTDARRLEAYYRSLGYLDARVGEPRVERLPSARGRQPMAVTFPVKEGPRYRVGTIEIQGARSLTRDTVRAFLSLTPGGTYSEKRLAEDCRKIESLFGRHGRAFTRVRARTRLGRAPDTLDVVYDIQESAVLRVGEVLVRGNTRTRENVVLREIDLRPGEVYDSRNLDRSRWNLVRSGLFDPRRLSINLRPGETPEEAEVLVDVAEARTGQLSLGATIDPESGDVIAKVVIQERNFNLFDPPKSWYDLVEGGALRGAGQSFGLTYYAGAEHQNVSVHWSDPWIGDSPSHWGLSTRFYDDFRERRDYDQDRIGGSVGVSRRLFGLRTLRVGTIYALEDIEIDDVDEDASTLLQEAEGRELVSKLSAYVSYDTRDWRPLPTSGWLLRAEQTTGGGILGGDRDFWKVHLTGRRYFTLWRTRRGVPLIGTLQGRANWAGAFGDSTDVPVYERFFTGGIGSVRGYDYRTISPRDPEPDGDYVGGNFLLVQNSELIVPLPLTDGTLRGSVFHDVGYVWPEDDDADLDDMKRSWGLGLWFVLPRQVGGVPIRIYWSWPINDDEHDDTDRVQVFFTATF